MDDVSALDVCCHTGNFIFASSDYEKTSERITYDYQWRMDQPDFGYLLWSGVGSCVFYKMRDWEMDWNSCNVSGSCGDSGGGADVVLVADRRKVV